MTTLKEMTIAELQQELGQVSAEIARLEEESFDLEQSIDANRKRLNEPMRSIKAQRAAQTLSNR
jgi:hypothetical protein